MIGEYANCPRHIFSLGKMRDPSDICFHMSLEEIKYYVYIFTCPKGVLKYGYSADIRSTFGDRIYRQAGHLNGWRHKLNGSSGSDMRIISENYFNKYNTVLDRNNMSIIVIDLSNHGIPGSQESHCKNLERMLIDDCIERNGAAPIGNVDPVTKNNIRKHHNTKLFKHFFEEV
jgi:hypothetical protein